MISFFIYFPHIFITQEKNCHFALRIIFFHWSLFCAQNSALKVAKIAQNRAKLAYFV